MNFRSLYHFLDFPDLFLNQKMINCVSMTEADQWGQVNGHVSVVKLTRGATGLRLIQSIFVRWLIIQWGPHVNCTGHH